MRWGRPVEPMAASGRGYVLGALCSLGLVTGPVTVLVFSVAFGAVPHRR